MCRWQKKVIFLSVSAAALLFAQVGTAGQNSVDLLLHKASYDLRLNSSYQGAISSMGGKIAYDLTSDCRGWLMTNELEMDVVYSTGQSMQMDLKINTWEALDGQHYRFTVLQDGNLSGKSRYIGKSSHAKASPGKSGEKVLAEITEPEKQDVELKDVIYPTAFLKDIILAAQDGETALNRTVFDGTAELDAFKVSAIILPNTEEENTLELKDKMSWKVFLAFYDLNSKSTLPIQEQTLTLYENGVVSSIDLDFGDFSVKGKMTGLEVNSSPQCG
ncbi:hypothetical protein WH96_13420 [Kiloniella spongiae]|uniref:DUF1849 family protein n=1 Tax=Kiloniella spongiae TaxID=1489064 RepID=A0A0H2MD97_9PROT|nr:DUF1849 family protein [Kiloniella spongiae]KLN60181.1 hypothetical protein WH96_13420 [Kiloniella spongiae]